MAQPNWYRKCVGCGQARHKRELLRIVRCPNNLLEIDPEQVKPGRGAYVCPNKQCALSVFKNHGFEKSFRIKVDALFYEQLLKQVEKNEH